MLERSRDVFDPLIPFEMEFKTPNRPESNPDAKVTLDLFFAPPPPLTAKAPCIHSRCLPFTETSGGDHILNVGEPYIAGSVSVFINTFPLPVSDFRETPETGDVFVHGSASGPDEIAICYVAFDAGTCAICSTGALNTETFSRVTDSGLGDSEFKSQTGFQVYWYESNTNGLSFVDGNNAYLGSLSSSVTAPSWHTQFDPLESFELPIDLYFRFYPYTMETIFQDDQFPGGVFDCGILQTCIFYQDYESPTVVQSSSIIPTVQATMRDNIAWPVVPAECGFSCGVGPGAWRGARRTGFYARSPKFVSTTSCRYPVSKTILATPSYGNCSGGLYRIAWKEDGPPTDFGQGETLYIGSDVNRTQEYPVPNVQGWLIAEPYADNVNPDCVCGTSFGGPLADCLQGSYSFNGWNVQTRVECQEYPFWYKMLFRAGFQGDRDAIATFTPLESTNFANYPPQRLSMQLTGTAGTPSSVVVGEPSTSVPGWWLGRICVDATTRKYKMWPEANAEPDWQITAGGASDDIYRLIMMAVSNAGLPARFHVLVDFLEFRQGQGTATSTSNSPQDEPV
jgi:hypothetical protein